MTGVTFLVPVLNGARWLDEVLARIEAQRAPGRGHEVVVVEDGSVDASPAILARWAARGVRVLEGPRRGAAAALNTGLRAASYDLLAQVDQDVFVRDGWLDALVAALQAAPDAAAAQGLYEPAPGAALWARVAALDLQQRWAAAPDATDHVCTGNTLYRTDALRAAGGFDERLGYGYDNDLSYRLVAAGRTLRLCRAARAVHAWSPGLRGFLRQQYGQGYGRLDLVARHPRRVRGDRVSGPGMMLHAAAASLAVALLPAAAAAHAAGLPARALLAASGAVWVLLAAERTLAGARAWRRFGDRAALAFPVAHLLRDAAWAAAVAAWTLRRLARRPPLPAHSMLARRRAATAPAPPAPTGPSARTRV